MTKTCTNYHLRSINKSYDSKNSFSKINDYLISFVGDIEVKKESETSGVIYYIGTPMTARMKLEEKGQITVSVNPDDNITINLINNISKNLGLRIYNPQTNSFLLNNVNIIDLTTIKIPPKIKLIFKQYQLNPLFQYRDSLVFFCLAKDNSIHLINRHLLEYLISSSDEKLYISEFSVKVAKNISQFVALFDRGLIPISFYKYLNGNSKVINIAGINIDKLYSDILIFPVYFNFDEKNQSFVQNETTGFPNRIEVKKGGSIIKSMNKIKYAAVKIAGDISYEKVNDKLIPKISISVFLN